MKLCLAVLVAGCKASTAVPIDAPATAWSMGPSIPDPRFEPGVTAMGQQVVVVGGFDTAAAVTARVDVLDTLDGTWRPLPDAPVQRYQPQVGAIGTTLYLLGGFGSAAAEGDCYAIDTGDGSAAAWQSIAAMPAGAERGAAAVVVVPPRIYLLGGASATAALASVIFYDAIEDAWCPGAACSADDQLPDLPAPRSQSAAMRRVDSTFIVAGGLAGPTADTAQSDVYLLAPDQQLTTGTWTMGAAMPEPRGGCAYGAVQDQLLCAGGEAGTAALASTRGYDSINDVWTDYPDMPQPRVGTQGAAVADDLYVPGGGSDLAIEPTDSVLVFSLDTARAP